MFSLEKAKQKGDIKMNRNKPKKASFNGDKLKGIIREKHLTQAEISQKLSIDKSTFNSKINGQVLFTQDELAKLIEILELPEDNLKPYFFTEKV